MMNLLHGISGLRRIAPGSILSIGNFDGVHRGHQRLLELGRALCGQTPGARLVVVTFEPHPFTVLRPEKAPPRLTPASIKRELLAELGVDELVELAPEPAVLNLTAEQFWMLLRDEVKPAHLIEGSEFAFGKDRGGNIDRLLKWTASAGVTLHVASPVEVPLFDLHVVPVSSTLIRWLLINGRARDAAVCLGRPYVLRGEVITGHQRGRQIGVPTANIRCNSQLVAADGVYVGRCVVDGTDYPAALSIGTLPTFGDSARQVEAHLVGFSGDLYGRMIDVEVTDWLREQWKFHGIDALKEQIALDIEQTVARATEDPARPVGAI